MDGRERYVVGHYRLSEALEGERAPLLRLWRHGHDLGFGISQGYATLGQIGFAERMDYMAIGTVCNLAARLCAEAKNRQILIAARVAIAVEDSAEMEEIGDLALKGAEPGGRRLQRGSCGDPGINLLTALNSATIE